MGIPVVGSPANIDIFWAGVNDIYLRGCPLGFGGEMLRRYGKTVALR